MPVRRTKKGAKRDVCFKDVLESDGATVLIKLLELKDKRSLRLVCHAAKNAVDKTVTVIRNCNDNVEPLFGGSYVPVHSNSWKHVKKLYYIPPVQPGSSDGEHGLIQIAKAGFSELERLVTHFNGSHNDLSAEEIIKAGWKLKELRLVGRVPQDWFGAIMLEADWPLELLNISECSDTIASYIGGSDWPLKRLIIQRKISPQGIGLLMRGSWVLTIEVLSFHNNVIEVKGAKAIAKASHKAKKLVELNLSSCSIGDEEALMLAEGSYPQVKELNLSYNSMKSCSLVAILKKCPMLTNFSWQSVLREPLSDLDDAKVIAQKLNGFTKLDLSRFFMTKSAARELFKYIDERTLETLYYEFQGANGPGHDFGDEVIAALAQRDFPCLKSLSLYDSKITAEGNGMFSAKSWPALERLDLDVAAPDLTIESKNLPKIKSLFLIGDANEAVRHIMSQTWPYLEVFSWVDQPAEGALERLKMIKTENMPNLKTLKLDKGVFPDSIKEVIEWSADKDGRYVMQWI